uniref:Uncharacterized protein n=1 Tax=Vitis vinifera TaxID=29760 RepID=A5CA19_VITVI|nr:hypothetical protein VITISV_036484 [Vitis vinifera]
MGEPSPLRKPLGTRGSACVEVMTTLHGSTPSPWRCAEGCVPPEGGFTVIDLDSPLWIRVGGRLTRVSDQLDQRSDQRDMDSQAIPFTLHYQTEAALPPITSPIPTSEDPHTRMDRLEQKLRQMRASDENVTWEDFDGTPVASLLAKFRMLEIERYTGIGCPRIHLRLYSTVMRAHGLNEAQMTLYGIEEGIARGLWSESSPIDSKGKKPSGGQRSGNVGFISLAGMRSPRHYRTVGQTSRFYYPPSPHVQYRPPVPSRPMTPTYLHSVSQPVFAAQGPGHDTDHCTTLRHAIQDLIDQGLINLGQPSVTTNPLPAHSTHAVSPSSGNIHHMDLIEDDSIHMLSWDDGLPESIVLHDSYEVDGVSLVPQTPAPFSLIPDEAPFQLTHPTPLVIGCQDAFVLFTLWPKDDDSDWREVQIVTRSGRIAQPPPAAVRPFEGAASHEEVKREDDEVLRQLQSTQAHISIWSLLASSSTHRDALIRALSQIRVETTTTPERLIHMMTVGRATCIVFSDDDLPPDGLDHVHPLYITVGFSSHRVPSVLLDNDSALNVCPLATAIALGFAPSDFGPFTQTVRAYDSTKREVMGTLMVDLQIGPTTFSTLFQVFRIPSSFNLLLGRPWIHIAGVIPSSLHQKVKFIHDGQVIKVRSTRDIFVVSELVLQISHSEDDLLLTGFTFDEIQTLEIEDFCRDFVAMSFDQHSNTVVLDMMRGMTFLPGMGLGRRQQGPSEFIAAIDHDTTFGLGFIPTEADYRYMARLCKERVRACLSHTPFDYPIRPYRMSLTDYFVRGSEIRPRVKEVHSVVHTDREIELQHLFHQLQLSNGVHGASISMATPTSPDRASMLSLCFPEEITDDGVIVDPIEMIDGVVPHDEYRDEMDRMTVS